MSAWRRTAIEILPEFRRNAEEAGSPMALWIELLLRFEDAFRVGDTALVDRMVDYAKWCLYTSDGDTVNAVAFGFLEHLPEHEDMHTQFPRWFTKSEFEQLKEVFLHHGGTKAVGQIQEEYLRACP